MWIWPLLNSQILTGGHESAAHKPTGCYWAAVPQLSIVTLSAHNLASALPLLTSVWKNPRIWISAFLKVSRSHPVSQFCLFDFETLSIPGLLRFAGRSWTRIAVAAPQISWYDFFHSLQLDQFICNVRMALAYYNCLILIKQYVYTLHVYMWCLTDRILHSMSV